MSVTLMGMVFARYPGGGGELLLALALSDHAHDDGTCIFPSVETLAKKTRQSQRTVQYQLRKMEEQGWLILVADESGGRGKAREYRISPEWLKGATVIAPFRDAEKGAIHDIKGAIHDIKGAIHDIKGATAVAPEPSEPSITKSNHKNAREVLIGLGVNPEVAADWVELRRKLKAPITGTVLREFQLEAKKAGYTLEEVFRTCCKNGWRGFEAGWVKDRGGGRVQTSEPPWWSSDTLIQAKGSELGLSARPGESMSEFKGRINAKIALSAGNGGARSLAG